MSFCFWSVCYDKNSQLCLEQFFYPISFCFNIQRLLVMTNIYFVVSFRLMHSFSLHVHVHLMVTTATHPLHLKSSFVRQKLMSVVPSPLIFVHVHCKFIELCFQLYTEKCTRSSFVWFTMWFSGFYITTLYYRIVLLSNINNLYGYYLSLCNIMSFTTIILLRPYLL